MSRPTIAELQKLLSELQATATKAVAEAEFQQKLAAQATNGLVLATQRVSRAERTMLSQAHEIAELRAQVAATDRAIAASESAS